MLTMCVFARKLPSRLADGADPKVLQADIGPRPLFVKVINPPNEFRALDGHDLKIYD